LFSNLHVPRLYEQDTFYFIDPSNLSLYSNPLTPLTVPGSPRLVPEPLFRMFLRFKVLARYLIFPSFFLLLAPSPGEPREESLKFVTQFWRHKQFTLAYFLVFGCFPVLLIEKSRPDQFLSALSHRELRPAASLDEHLPSSSQSMRSDSLTGWL